MTWSDDEGGTWSDPASPFVPPNVEGRPGLFRAGYITSLGGKKVVVAVAWVDYSNPSLPFFNETTEGLLDTRIFFSFSEDGGGTWSSPELMDTAPFPPPTPLTGPVLLLPDGRWACQFELNKRYDDLSPWRHSSVLMYSDDGGKTWPEHARVSDDPDLRYFYWDQRPAVLADGRILDVFWTFDRKKAVYLNIHARESLDQGRTWSAMWDTGAPGQAAPPLSLPDGRVVMVYVDRTAAPVIKLRVSEDHGKTWPEETEFVIYESVISSQTRHKESMQDAWAEMFKFSVGLPATAATGDGDILVVYYAGQETEHTGIEWARLRA